MLRAVSDAAADVTEPFAATSPWKGEARALLERALERHGGWTRWTRMGGIGLRLEALSGVVPDLKGVGRTFPMFSRAEVWPRKGVTVMHDYPVAGRRGVFSAGQVQILEGETILEARVDPRASFAGLRKHRRWSPLDALYFFGYALAHYHALPFSLVEARPLRMRRARSAGRSLVGVEVALPASLPTHSSRQTFYFDEEGLLRRHDYVADIIGWWARGAHRWEDFVEVGGQPVALRRHVVLRLGHFEIPAVVALHAELRGPKVLGAVSRPALALV
jgi:hypothetical protein